MSIRGLNTLLTGALGSLGRAQVRELGGAGANLYRIDRLEEARRLVRRTTEKKAGYGEAANYFFVPCWLPKDGDGR